MYFRLFSSAALVTACFSFASVASATPPGTTGGSNACGHVSTEAGNVPTRLGIFHANIIQIDGRPAGMDRYQYKLRAGKHILVLAEEIDRARLNSAQIVQIEKMQRHSAAPLKALILDVQPGTSYRLGARLLRDKLDTQSIRDNAYWEPMVWEEVPQACL